MINPLSAVARIFKSGPVAQASGAARPAAVAASLARQTGLHPAAWRVPGRTDPNTPLPVVGRERFAFLAGLGLHGARQGLIGQASGSTAQQPYLTVLQKARMVMAGVDEHGRKVGLDMRQKLSFQRHMNWHGFGSAAIAEREGVQAQASRVLAQTQAALLAALAGEGNGADAAGWANRLLAVLPLHLHSDQAFAAWAGPDLNVHVQAGPTADGQQGETRTVNVASYQDLVALARGRLPGVSSPRLRATMQLSGDVMSRLAKEAALEQAVANPRPAQPLVSTAAYCAYLNTEQRVHEVRHLGATALQLLRRLPGAANRSKAETRLADRVAQATSEQATPADRTEPRRSVSTVRSHRSADEALVPSASVPVQLDEPMVRRHGPLSRIEEWVDEQIPSAPEGWQGHYPVQGAAPEGHTLQTWLEERAEEQNVVMPDNRMQAVVLAGPSREVSDELVKLHDSLMLRVLNHVLLTDDPVIYQAFMRDLGQFERVLDDFVDMAMGQPAGTYSSNCELTAEQLKHRYKLLEVEYQRVLMASTLPVECKPSFRDFLDIVEGAYSR